MSDASGYVTADYYDGRGEYGMDGKIHNFWYACEHPERPPDQWTEWHAHTSDQDCRGCTVKADALHRQYPDSRNARYLADMTALGYSELYGWGPEHTCLTVYVVRGPWIDGSEF